MLRIKIIEMAFAPQQTGAHLMINPFGEAHLYYMDKEIANSSRPTSYPIGTTDFKFLIRVNDNGSFDIQRSKDVAYNVTIEDTVKVCQVQVRSDKVMVPPWYSVMGDVLSHNYSLRQTAEFNNDHFRVRLVNSKLFRRIDCRFLQHSWFTMVVSNHQLMTVCVNATRELEILQWACADIIVQAKTQMPNVTASQLGLSPSRVAPRNEGSQSVRSVNVATENHATRNRSPHQEKVDEETVASEAATRSINNQTVDTQPRETGGTNTSTPAEHSPSSTPDEVPNLVIATDHDAIRVAYIKQLEMALAAFKIQEVKKTERTE